MLTIDKISRTAKKLGRKYGLKRVYLFGSYARNEANENSDVDFLIEKGDLKSFRNYIALCNELERDLGTKVDVVTDSSIRDRSRLSAAINRDRILLYGA